MELENLGIKIPVIIWEELPTITYTFDVKLVDE